MCPQKFQKRGELPTLATPPRVGPKTLANLQPTGVGKGGPGERSPHGRGCGGCAPQNFQRRGKQLTLVTPPRVGPKAPANPSAHEGGQRGVQGGEAPMAGGVGGVPPQYQRGASSQPLQPRHEWDPKRWQIPSPRGWEMRNLLLLQLALRSL
jgi:hypothetical protein